MFHQVSVPHTEYGDIIARDMTRLDIFWLKNLSDLDNLPESEELTEEIITNLQAALDSFKEIVNGLGNGEE